MENRPESKLPDHPVRVALLDLLAELGTVTANEAARRLGYSSGLCSFHLRQLARAGLIEEAPRGRGRIKPWRLRWDSAQSPDPDDQSFSAVLHLTPHELAELTASVRELIKRFPERASGDPDSRPVEVNFSAFLAPVNRTRQ
ncbi:MULTISPECIES: winged helix-turn-helix domain-containing protein [Amycolatopsis]|uniref:HTH arsR-type domain-containing protein n=1 Tax=Amycolatopsis tucumanensis TaxID=401106 RepID=A0ABP7IEP4_9PSEU|nr:helix-turn-helix domain-containing protein [Amycolatopsis tucumanensis]MCF6429235.1 helix-turn-helix domain-containing protein [Amycolatopsis tucumanensis]